MTKRLLSTLFVLSVALFATAQVSYINTRLNYIDGKGVQAGKLDGGGIGLQFERFKSAHSKLGYIISAESNFTGQETKTADLSFSGSNASTDVDYYSSLNKLTGGFIFVPMHGSFVSPYISLQGGVMWYRTKLVIEDPDDPSSCSPMETKNVKLSFSGMGNVETGIKVQVKRGNKNSVYIQGGVGYNIGTKATYIKLGDEANDETTQSYTSKFKMSNGSVHEHSIGTMYRTRTSQLEYSVGVNFPLEFNR